MGKQARINAAAKAATRIFAGVALHDNIAIRMSFFGEMSILATFKPSTVEKLKADNKTSDECFEIIEKCIPNLNAARNIGSSRALSAQESQAVQNSLQGVCCAVLKMQLNDVYRAPLMEMTGVVLHTELKDVDGNIGWDLLSSGQAMLNITKGVQSAIDKKDYNIFAAF
jgi:copper chaperone CopZ